MCMMLAYALNEKHLKCPLVCGEGNLSTIFVYASTTFQDAPHVMYTYTPQAFKTITI